MKKFLSPVVRRIIARLVDGPLSYKTLKAEFNRPDQIVFNSAVRSLYNQGVVTWTPIDAYASEDPTIDLPHREAWLAVLASTIPEESRIVSARKLSCSVATIGAINTAGHPVTVDEITEMIEKWGLPYTKEQVMATITSIRDTLDGRLITRSIKGEGRKAYSCESIDYNPNIDNRIEEVPEMHFSELRAYIAKWKEENPGRKIFFSAKDMRWHSEVIA